MLPEGYQATSAQPKQYFTHQSFVSHEGPVLSFNRMEDSIKSSTIFNLIYQKPNDSQRCSRMIPAPTSPNLQHHSKRDHILHKS